MTFHGDIFRWRGASIISSLLLIFFVFLVIHPTLAAVPIEQDTLLKMKQSWKDPENGLKDWIKGSDCSEWKGVSCDSSGHVIGLSLSDNLLSGPIPSTIGSLKNLQELSLSHNQLIGSIPSTIGSLKNLQRLWLSYNQLSGNIPSTIGSLKNLESLYLNDNQLSGSIPSTIGSLKNLIFLYLHSNKLSGSIPSTISGLTNLMELGLSSNKLGGPIPSNLGNLTKLVFLFLNTNNLIGVIPSTIGNLQSLYWIDISSNQLSGFIPSNIAKLYTPFNLKLQSNYFVGNFKIQCGGLLNCNLTANCLQGVSKQRSITECVSFCGANSPSGPCSGHGRCSFNPNKKAFCTCDKGWALPKCQSKISK